MRSEGARPAGPSETHVANPPANSRSVIGRKAGVPMNIMNAVALVPPAVATSPAVVHVVDADAALRDSLRHVLEIAGHPVRCHASAADFLLPKPIEREPLLAMVGSAIQRAHAQQAMRHRRRAVRERFALLTTRERTVFEHVAAGRLNKQIAATLCTCERTVKAHRANVMHKMQAHSVAELVRIAIQLEADAEVAN